jgi:DeoR/GlpR family transcriptional regulator of sugar metabolism
MKAAARQQLIIEIIESSGRVQVSDLSTRAGVSNMTIRRDLEQLETAGALIRIHGGAVTSESRSYEPGYHARSVKHAAEKQRIGQAAARLISEGETLILDAGSTSLQVAEALKGRRNLRVLAISLRVAEVLADEPGIVLTVPGGVVRPHERALYGSVTEHAFSNLYFDTFVGTVGGVDVEGGVTEYDFDDCQVKRAAVASARRVMIVADSTKLDRVAFARVTGMDGVDTLVTDTGGAESAVVQHAETTGLNVVLA